MSLTDIQKQQEECKSRIFIAEAVTRLSANTEFDFIFNHVLFTEKVNELVSSMAGTDINSAEYTSLVRELDCISYLKKYLQTLVSQGSYARYELSEVNSMLSSEEST